VESISGIPGRTGYDGSQDVARTRPGRGNSGKRRGAVWREVARLSLFPPACGRYPCVTLLIPLPQFVGLDSIPRSERITSRDIRQPLAPRFERRARAGGTEAAALVRPGRALHCGFDEPAMWIARRIFALYE